MCIKQYHKVRYYNMLAIGTLNIHLAEIDQRAEQMFQSLVSALSKQENVTEYSLSGYKRRTASETVLLKS